MGILLIEDDEVTGVICKTVIAQISNVWWAKSIKQAKVILSSEKVELIIADIHLPDGDGIDFYKQNYTSNSKTPPVIFLTQDNGTPTKVSAFSMGAIDYISKPFDAVEFQARLQAHWTRLSHKERFFEWGPYKLDQESMRVSISSSMGFNEIDCTNFELKILVLFLKSPEKIFTREEIIERIWGAGHHVTERNIDSHIARLRKKISTHGGMIESVRGCGYRLTSIQAKAG